MARGPLSLVEKIAQRCVVKGRPGPREFVQIRPHKCMTHDNSAAVIEKFESLGVVDIHAPDQLVFTLDHNVQDRSERNLAKYQRIAAFARAHGIDAYGAGRGIGHQVMVEEGHVLPGTMVVASDSHSNMYGGLGCLGTPVVRTDAAGIWATGETWWQIPHLAKVRLSGSLQRDAGATSKDIIIALCGLFNNDEVLNHAVEFCGPGLADLSVDDRLTIANMTTEWGAVAGVFPADATTFKWLESRAKMLKDRPACKRLNLDTLNKLHAEWESGALSADEGAEYDIELELDVSTVEPFISGPNHVKCMLSAADIQNQRIQVQKAYIVSCVNSRVDDIAAAANVIRQAPPTKRQIASGVELYIAAASSEVETASRSQGDWQVLLDAGAIPLPSGCGPCVGLGAGLLKDGEIGISATNRNFKGRMGARSAKAYLGSPSVVAASALAGIICAPPFLHGVSSVSTVSLKGGLTRKTTRSINTSLDSFEVSGFPISMMGKVLFCYQDNLNTDGIFSGLHTYKENMTPAEMAAVCMENYDPEFSRVVQRGDILVGGFNFGCGSSREQAATALKHCGIDVVLAGSFSETYKRNSFNNGLLCLEVPVFVQALKDMFEKGKLTRRIEGHLTLDFLENTVVMEWAENDEPPLVVSILPLGNVAQELFAAGSLVDLISTTSKEVHEA